MHAFQEKVKRVIVLPPTSILPVDNGEYCFVACSLARGRAHLLALPRGKIQSS